MALSYSLITLAELKAWMPLTGNAADAVLDTVRSTATRMIEGYLGRRIIFRAPGSGENAVLSAFAWPTGAGAPAVSNQPNSAGRTLIVTWTTATAGTITITGTVGGVAGITETFDVANGLVQFGVKFFTAVSTIAIANGAGVGTVAITTSLGYVEYHSRPSGTGQIYGSYRNYGTEGYIRRAQQLYTRERPILNVLEVNEDPNRTFGASTKLVENTDFIVSRQDGRLLRWMGGVPAFWPCEQRVVRDTYSAGYFTVANVPYDLKDVCLRLSDRIYSEKGREGATSYTDAAGTVTRLGPAFLTDPMREQLAEYRRHIYDPSQTAEWDFDEEAA